MKDTKRCIYLDDFNLCQHEKLNERYEKDDERRICLKSIFHRVNCFYYEAEGISVQEWQPIPEGMNLVPTHVINEILDNYDLTGDLREILIDCLKV